MIKFKLSDIPLLLIVSVLTISNFQLSAQETTNSTYLNWFDNKVGIENTALYEGIVYREAYRTINEKVKFFKSAQWYNGSVVYSGQEFYNVQLKYDVYGDQLILKQLDRLGGGALILFKSKVSSFKIEDSEFVHLKGAAANTEIDGFYELLWTDTNIRLLAKHQKNDFVRKDRSAAYYEFVDEKKQYLIELDGAFYPANKKKEITDLFIELKKEVDNFYQKNKRLRSRDGDAFMISLLRNIDQLSNDARPNQGS